MTDIYFGFGSEALRASDPNKYLNAAGREPKGSLYQFDASLKIPSTNST